MARGLPKAVDATSRRSVLGMMGGSVATALSPAALAAIAPASPSPVSRLHLLGTGGGPAIGLERGMACNAITVGDKVYVIDCGLGATEALSRGGIRLSGISSIFITHNHADHMIGYGPLLFACWLQGKKDRLGVYGPPPIAKVTDQLLAANDVPLQYYKSDMGMHAMAPVDVHEIDGPGLVFDDGVARVSCTKVVHPPVFPSFGYRFDLPDRSIVFSGDTANSNALVALAKAADVLVHEATIVEDMLRMMQGSAGAQGRSTDGASQPQGYNEDMFRDHVLGAHTSAEDAGRIAAEAGVKTLVLNHLAPSSTRIVDDGTWIRHARRHFAGQIIVAHDGLVI